MTGSVVAAATAGLLAAALVPLTGCAEPEPLQWRIRFDDPLLDVRARTLEVEIRRDSCGEMGEVLDRFVLDGTGTPVRAPVRLPSGSYALSAAALDASCVMFATGCASVELPLGEPLVEVALVGIDTPGVACSTAQCRDGICDAADGGLSEELWVEAEHAEVRPPMRIESGDDEASGAAYVTVDPTVTPAYDGSPLGWVRVRVPVSTAGRRYVWGRVQTPGADANSFWVRIDEGPWIEWNVVVRPGWTWDRVMEPFEVSEGEHVVDVAYRESGVSIDHILIVDDADRVPTGLGG